MKYPKYRFSNYDSYFEFFDKYHAVIRQTLVYIDLEDETKTAYWAILIPFSATEGQAA